MLVTLASSVVGQPLLFLRPSVVSLQQYCDQIDQVEASVIELEQTAYRLDTYAKQLGECVCVYVCVIGG